MVDPLPDDLRPGITALVRTHSGVDRVERALTSLAAQSLDPAHFEILVVPNGPDDGTINLVRRFSAGHPELDLRIVRSPAAGIGVSMNVGLAAARREFFTVVDDDDQISAAFLEQLLAYSEPGLIAHGYLANVGPDGTGPADFDTYVNRSLGPAMGHTTHPSAASASLMFNVAKSVWTPYARAVRARENLRFGTDVLYWHELVNTFALPIRLLPSEAHAVYYRSLRADSHSRPSELGHDLAVEARLDTMEALTPLVLDPANYVAEVARHSFVANTRAIGRYLRECPDEHERVLASVSARELPEFTVRVLNRGRARDLITCYCFVPSNNTSALVAARRVRERGVCVDVISHDMTGTFEKDAAAAQIAAPYVGSRLTVKGPPKFAQWAGIAEFCHEGVAAIESWEETRGPYRSVYSRAMWPASHVLAALHKARNPAAKWIAEFSDPLSINMKGNPRKGKRGTDALSAELDAAVTAMGFPPEDGGMLMPWIEHLAYALADEIVFTNDHQMTTMLEQVSNTQLLQRVRDKAVVSPHPTLPKSFYERSDVTYGLDPNRSHLAYFGAFYATRGLTEVTDALHALPRDVRHRVQLHVFTKDPADLRRELKEAHLDDVVVANEYVPYLDFLRLTTLFDCLVVNDARTADHHAVNPYLPSKISDYRGSGRPIWAIVEEGSTMSKLDTEYRTALGDVAGAIEVLSAVARASSIEQPAG
ncbi:glycosyltransferase [Aeromicrobium sp.]|uniref:glycosyltransferase n=1 Tax=Aeromicrobium sp. TaxID=1871063 RepID=UPI003C5AD81D